MLSTTICSLIHTHKLTHTNSYIQTHTYKTHTLHTQVDQENTLYFITAGSHTTLHSTCYIVFVWIHSDSSTFIFICIILLFYHSYHYYLIYSILVYYYFLFRYWTRSSSNSKSTLLL